MARVDYFAIAEAMQTRLRAASTLSGVTVEIERQWEDLGNFVNGGVVIIYHDRRDIEQDYIAAGKKVLEGVRWSVWVGAFHLDSLKKASEMRDDLLGNVQIALQGDRTLGSLVRGTKFEGGRFLSAQNGGSFLTAAELIVTTAVTGTVA